MSLDFFLFQLALVFLPGIVWANIDIAYAHKGPRTQFDLLLKAFLFGVFTYSVVFLVYEAAGWKFGILEMHSGREIDISLWDEVVVAVLLAIIFSVLWLYVSNRKVITRFLQWIRATKTYGAEDVWDFTLNARDAAVEYVHVRDLATGLTYAGWVSTFSETGRLRELVLRDVIVTDLNTGEELYTVPRVYLAREPSNITLEFPYTGNSTDKFDEAEMKDGGQVD